MRVVIEYIDTDHINYQKLKSLSIRSNFLDSSQRSIDRFPLIITCWLFLFESILRFLHLLSMSNILTIQVKLKITNFITHFWTCSIFKCVNDSVLWIHNVNYLWFNSGLRLGSAFVSVEHFIEPIFSLPVYTFIYIFMYLYKV